MKFLLSFSIEIHTWLNYHTIILYEGITVFNCTDSQAWGGGSGNGPTLLNHHSYWLA